MVRSIPIIRIVSPASGGHRYQPAHAAASHRPGDASQSQGISDAAEQLAQYITREPGYHTIDRNQLFD
jgi:hypothetical protein